MPLIIQLYILTIFVYIILSQSVNIFYTDRLLRWVSFLLVYAGLLRVLLAFVPGLPTFFHESVFMAFTLFVPGAYLCLRNYVTGSSVKKSDLVHALPFLLLVIAGVLISFFGTNIQAEIKRIWTFSSEAEYDPNVVMPLFLFIYCLTAFYFFRVLLLFKTVLLKQEGPAREEELLRQPLNESSADGTEAQHQFLIISPERMVEIDFIVKEVLGRKKPYLQQRYSLKDLAVDTNISLHHLSAFINKYWGKNFNDFINEFRVQHCVEKILNEEYKHKKLEAIAEESGFNNRNTFAIAFKKVTGLKPSEYLRNLKSAEQENKKPLELDPQGFLPSIS